MLSRQLVAYLQATARPAKLHTHTRPTPTCADFHAAPTMTSTLTPTLTSTLIPTMTPTLTSTLPSPTFRLVCNQPASCCGFATRAVLCFLCFPGSQTRPRELAGCKPARTWEKRGRHVGDTWKPAHPHWERRRSVLPNMPFRPAKQHISQAQTAHIASQGATARKTANAKPPVSCIFASNSKTCQAPHIYPPHAHPR